MTSADLGLAAGDAIVLVVGYALLYALGLARRWSDVRLLGLGYLLGWALLGSVLSLLLIAGIDVGLVTIVVAAAVLTTGCVLAARWVGEVVPPVVTRGRHPLGLVVALLGAAIVAAEAFAALVVSLSNWDPDIDVVTFWGPRAAIIYYSHHLEPSIWGTYRHPEYPPLGPAMNATMFHFAGGFHPSLIALQQTLLGIAFLLAVLALLDRYAPRWVSLPSLALLVTAPWFWWRLQSVLPDQALAYLIASAALTSVLWLRERRPAWLGLALVFLIAASLLKLEGSFFGALLVAVVLAAGLILHRRAGVPALVLALGPAAILPWHLWLAHHGLPASATDYSASDLFRPSYLAARTFRLHEAITALSTPGANTQAPAIMYVAFVVLAVAAVRIPVIAAAVAAWLGLAFFGLATIYWIGRPNIGFYLTQSVTRVGATIVIVAATVTPLLLGLALRPRSSDP